MSIIDELNSKFYAIVYTYKTVGIDNLAHHYLREEEIKDLYGHFKGEMNVVQTCNRVELYLFTDYHNYDSILSYLNHIHNKDITRDATIFKGTRAARHLFEVAAGLDSMSVGEYEILSQIKLSIQNAKKMNISNKYIETIFERAIKVGRRVRQLTDISKGKVGIYSVAVEMARNRIKDLDNRKILIIGAGKMGNKIAQILHSYGYSNVTIMNRTKQKGENLATKFGFRYEKLDFSKINDYDIIFSAIFYPTKISANNTLVIDISSPNIFEGKNVITLKELEDFSSEMNKLRVMETWKAEKIIEEGLNELISDLANLKYDEIISDILTRMEEIRQKEVERALKELKKRDAEDVLNSMSKAMLKKIMSPMLEKVREAVKNDETNYINLILELFDNGKLSHSKTKKITTEQANERHNSGNGDN
ncbi:glutamyl-tRNA reductase [Acidianus sp. RZ1]|uniref:glutamyl-tRNA reductase n=1 Tax=Acidianus sp. RZ1 TaxID=1540082 RepID=UPI001491FF73|nr:glutamyl-tRNA reductase [Acidianus sp. RZ1]NON63588.1 glutamyl-tRNA reductase [Acidianus sp. RZ1]